MGKRTINSRLSWQEIFNDTVSGISTEYESTGKTFTLNRPAIILIVMGYGSGRPTAIGAKLSESAASTSALLLSVDNNDINNTSGLSVTGLVPAGTYYIWARTAIANGSSLIRINGLIL